MEEPSSSPAGARGPTSVALCIEADAYRRLRPCLRHLCVGMIDYSVSGRLISRSAEVGRLSFGPLQMLAYEQPPWGLRRLRGARRRRMDVLADKLAERPPNLVHAVSADAFEVGHFLANRFDVDLVLQVTSFRDIAAITPALQSRVDCLIAGSQPLLDRVEPLLKAHQCALRVIRPGMLAASEPTCFDRPDAIPAVLCSEAFVPGCGVPQLLQAVQILREKKRQVLLFLTGTGPLEHDLRRRSDALGLSATVVFAHPTGSLERVMVGADIFIHPRVDEAIRVDPLFAMANGLAVVAAQGGAPDCFVDGVTALVLEEAKPQSIAEAIERLLDDRGLAIGLAAGALRHIRSYHTISAMAEHTVEQYTSLLSRRQTFVLNR